MTKEAKTAAGHAPRGKPRYASDLENEMGYLYIQAANRFKPRHSCKVFISVLLSIPPSSSSIVDT